MKLRNKKTGEIVATNGLNVVGEYESLTKLTEEREDYEEPKEYWTIDWTYTGVTTNKYTGDDIDDFNESIGNFFETKEEAEKAVEKLKAWKRLKDKDFRFGGWVVDSDGDLDCVLCYRKDGVLFNNAETLAMANDLNLLFGAEE